MLTQFKSDVEAIDALAQSYKDLSQEISKVIVGQNDVVRAAIISLFSNGHSLLVGVPGLAKTLLINTLAQVLDLSFKRIQFTPDLMPSDITGSEILDEDRHFRFNRGPLFANIVLADEINRTPPKTQAALLEAMQERIVTVSGTRHVLPNPFFVLATQNPIEQEGTYPLPEAQLDRFMFNIPLDYPSYQEELDVVKQTTMLQKTELKSILSADQILYYQQVIRKIPIADNVLEYAVGLASRTRPKTERATKEVNTYVSWGAGPRASQNLVLGAKCYGALKGKYSPDIEDVQAIAGLVLRHRIVVNYKAEADGLGVDQLIKTLL
jgi:MoxR-like ATPase